MTESVRLQKILAQCGLGSRRQIEAWISAGRIKVNGVVADLGQKITIADQVLVNEQPIDPFSLLPSNKEVLLYYKPEGEICTRKDPEGRPTIFTHLPPCKTGRWQNIGRLDLNTSGLLLLTNDGELANRLMHPRYQVEREYAVRIHGKPSKQQIQQLLTGVQIEPGQQAKFQRVTHRGGPGSNQWYDVVLTEGRNREVRRLWEAIGFTVTRLLRIRYGTITLGSNMRPGQYRWLTATEIQQLWQEENGS